MKIRKLVAAAALLTVLPLGACSLGATEPTTTTSSTTTTGTTESGGTTDGTGGSSADGAPQGGGPGGVDVGSVSTEEQLIALVQQAYGDAGLGLHRGHQPVEGVLTEVLTISHDELHTRMDAGQNLAAVATDVGIDPQVLIDKLVESWSPAIDRVLATGAITADEAQQYRAALREAFTFRVTWNGTDPTPAFSGLGA